MKKLLRFLRAILVGMVWSYVFLLAAGYIMFALWNFNLMSAHSWQTIARFWESGGVINTGTDYVFLAMLCSLPILWAWGWHRLLRLNYADILLWPIIAYNRHIINKYGHNSSRVVLRNLKSSQKMIEEIKDQIESIKPAKTQEVGNIRSQVQKRLEELNKPN